MYYDKVYLDTKKVVLTRAQQKAVKFYRDYHPSKTGGKTLRVTMKDVSRDVIRCKLWSDLTKREFFFDITRKSITTNDLAQHIYTFISVANLDPKNIQASC